MPPGTGGCDDAFCLVGDCASPTVVGEFCVILTLPSVAFESPGATGDPMVVRQLAANIEKAAASIAAMA